MVKEIRHKSSFPAQDREGKTHRLKVFVEILDVGTLGNPNAEIEGRMSIKTRDGDSVNRLDKGKYEIVQSGAILTSDAPEAP
jgi:hypothetical protein